MNPTAVTQHRLKPVGGAVRNLIYQVLGGSGGFESASAARHQLPAMGLLRFIKIIRRFLRGMNPTAGRQNRLKPVGGALCNLIDQVLGNIGGFESASAAGW
jgi:hypothetical protein